MISLTISWAVLLSAIILTYIILDGFGLGVGILFPWVHDRHSKDIMISTIAPVWDGNQTWVVLGAGGLYGAFPIVFGLLLPALYMPIMMMVLALVFRGIVFEFRFKVEHHRTIWDACFSVGCTLAAFIQGMMLGRFVQGYDKAILEGTLGAYDWITPFSLLTGVTVVVGYALLGSTWLIMKTEGSLQAQLFKLARWLLFSTALLLGLVCISTLLLNSHIVARWFEYCHVLWIIPVVTAILVSAAFYGLRKGWDTSPFFLSIGLFICSYVGFGVSLWPYVIPFVSTIWETAAPPSSLRLSLAGTAIILPILLGYTSYTYYVFRGKVTRNLHY